MRRHSVLIGLVLVGMIAAVGANAAPIVTYSQLDPSAANSLDAIEVIGAGCVANQCLANGPLDIDAASVTLDLGTNQLIDLNVFVSGPGIVTMGSVAGLDQAIFTDVTLDYSGGPVVLGAGGSFTIFGSVSAGSVFLDYTVLPDTMIFDYVNPNASLITGFVTLNGGQVVATVTGAELGRFVLPNGTNPAIVTAKFGFVAAVPEPSAAVLYALGLAIAASSLRRRSFAAAHRGA